MNEIKLSLTQNEVDALLQLIDVAIKAQGLQISEAGTFLAKKITDQVVLPEENSSEAQ